MISVYFDSQIFRYLKNKDKYPGILDTISNLEKCLQENRSKFLFFYSHAHLLDLDNDLSDKKYDDLNFIENIVDDNYLCHTTENKTHYYLFKPNKAYQNMVQDKFDGSNLDIREIFSLDKLNEIYDNNPPKEIVESLNLIENITLSDLIPNINVIPTELKETLSKFLPLSNPNIPFLDYINTVSALNVNFQEDISIYKDLRNLISNKTNGAVTSLDLDSFDFVMEMKDTKIEKHFLDFVKDSVHKKDYTQFDLHYQCYFHLDLLGLETDKKVKTKNILHDAHHSFYASYCDIFVSDDAQIKLKSKIVNKLFDIETKILSIEEFINFVNEYSKKENKNERTLFLEMMDIIISNKVRKVLNPFPGRRVRIFDNDILLFDYFNEIRLIEEGKSKYVVYRHEIKNYHGANADFKVIEAVVNKAIRLFGLDEEQFGNFSFKEERKEINEDKWRGRYWLKNIGWGYSLEINSSSGCLNLIYFKL
jgi:hypothetical protein